MREPRTKNIDGVDYTVAPLGAEQGFPIAIEIGQMFAPFVSKIESLDSLDASVFPAIAELLGKLSGKRLMEMAKLFAEQTTVAFPDGRKLALSATGVFGVHFAANYMALMKFLVFAAEVNGVQDFRPSGHDGDGEDFGDEAPRITIPARIEWRIWRIAVSGRFHSSLIEIQRDWSVRDVQDANAILDALDKAEREAFAKRGG